MRDSKEKCIIVFKSRNHTTRFFEYISKRGISAEIINTPSKLALGCGLSVKFYKKDIFYIERVQTLLSFYSYAGIFPIEN